MSEDTPFVLRGGDSHDVALYNRINAINQIKYLSKVDLREKSSTFLKLLDLEMWTRWYKNKAPDDKISEEFCQRAAEVILAMEGNDPLLDEQEFNNAVSEHTAMLLTKEKNNVNEHAESSEQDAEPPGQQVEG